VIESFIGSLIQKREYLNRAIAESKESIIDMKEKQFSRNRDYKLKRMMPSTGDLAGFIPEYRFRVSYGKSKKVVNWQEICRLYDF